MRIEEIYKGKILKFHDLKPFFKKGEESTNKLHLIYVLIRHQLKHWPLLTEVYEKLKMIKIKKVEIDRINFEVNYNPLRQINVAAKIDRKTIESGSCFLCPEKLYKEQNGIVVEDFLVILNPRPTVVNHLTLVSNHKPQHIDRNVVSQMLKLAKEIHPFRLLYNPPGAGASLPNHLHLQALPCKLPVEKGKRGIEIMRTKELAAYRLEFPSKILLVEGKNPTSIIKVISKILNGIEKLGYIDNEWNEHMINIWASYLPENKVYRVFIVPRSKHRSHDFGLGENEIAISPGMLEMGGKITVVNETTFNRVDGKLIRRILDEVSMPKDDFKKLVKILF